jgi:hypothetical protein
MSPASRPNRQGAGAFVSSLIWAIVRSRASSGLVNLMLPFARRVG